MAAGQRTGGRQPLRHVSTRGAAPTLDFDETLLAGLAPDGGLYMPEAWPKLDMPGLAGRPYRRLAEAVLRPFVGDGIVGAALPDLIDGAYSGFRHPAVAPLREIDDGLWLMELFTARPLPSRTSPCS